MIKKAKFDVVYTTSKTLEKYIHEDSYEDEYGRWAKEKTIKWRPTTPDLYYIIGDDKLFYRLPPSGKYNEFYGFFNRKELTDYEVCGTFDGEYFNGCKIPNIGTSLLELQQYDVFTLEEEYRYKNIFSKDEDIVIPVDVSLVLESPSKLRGEIMVSFLDDPKKRTTIYFYNDILVKVIGKIKVVREFIEF